MCFQSVLDPIAHDYSQVQNCMHTQLQQQFTDCEFNQPIVSTISCSLLVWKELGRWLPLQLASCGQLGLLVQFCTLKHGIGQKWCVPRNFIRWAPNIQPHVHPPVSIHDHEGLCPRSVWRPQPQGERRCNDWAQTSRNATLTKETKLSIFGRGGRETDEMLTWVGTGKRVLRVRKT